MTRRASNGAAEDDAAPAADVAGNGSTTGPAQRRVQRWLDAVQRRHRRVCALALLLAVACAVLVATRLKVDTDNRNLLSADLPWRVTERALAERFPQLDHSLVAVIDAPSPALAAEGERRLLAHLQSGPAVFDAVFALDADPYFRRSGLLFLDPPALQAVADGITAAQPFLGPLARETSLRTVFALLARGVDQAPEQAAAMLPAFTRLTTGTQAALDGASTPIAWNFEDSGNTPGAQLLQRIRRFVEVAPRLEFDRLFPAGRPMAALRAAGNAASAGLPGLRVRITGAVAMEHEELQTAFGGAGVALALSLGLSALLLWLAVRSLRLVAAAVVTLVTGLLVTAAFAALAIGHLNLISVAFGVLYVGLGLDYALYLCMQLRERVGQGLPLAEAVSTAGADVAGYMLVCALTVSIGFFAFVPTAFRGLGELGVIAGAGMFVSLGLALSLLPALIRLWPPDVARIAWTPASGPPNAITQWPYRHARRILVVLTVLATGAALLVPRARFDADPLNLRDPHSEALSTFRDLQRDPELPTLTLSTLAPDADAARALAQRLAALPEVRRAMTLEDFVPTQQTEKLAILDELRFALGPDLTTAPAGDAPPPLVADDAADLDALDALRTALRRPHPQFDAATMAAAQALATALDRVDADGAHRLDVLRRLRSVLLGSLPQQLDDLRTALQAGPVTEADLPPALVARWRSADGRERVEISPKQNLDDPAAAAAFIAAVRRVAPDASGAPIAQAESAHAIVGAFEFAFAAALAAITLVLLVLLRSVVDTLLVLIPLLLAGLFTTAGSVLLGVPFNFANVIALPLILGVGVDYGVYLVQRGREPAAAAGGLLRTGTARAVLFGALITLANFGNLMFARHPGMVSMGVLLTVGLSATLLCALVVLPGLLARRYAAVPSSGIETPP